jgi:hypothetical protein
MKHLLFLTPIWSPTMKKFITALATTFATLVIGSAASAATPTFNVYHEEVLPALVAANTSPTFNVVREEILPAMAATVADYNWDAIPTSEHITPVTVANYNWEALPESEHFTIDADPYSEQIVGGLGPQLPYDPMRGVDYGFVQALNKLNADPFAERIFGGLGPQLDNDPYSERIVGGLGPQSDLDPMMTVMTDWVQPATNVDPFSEEVVGGLGPQINFVASN